MLLWMDGGSPVSEVILGAGAVMSDRGVMTSPMGREGRGFLAPDHGMYRTKAVPSGNHRVLPSMGGKYRGR